MTSRLTKHGDRLALVLEPEMLESLGIDESTELELSVEGGTLIIAPMQDSARQKRFEQALEATNAQYANALKRLAE